MTFIYAKNSKLSLDGGETWLPLESASFETEDSQSDEMQSTAHWENFVSSLSVTVDMPPTKENLISTELVFKKDGRWN